MVCFFNQRSLDLSIILQCIEEGVLERRKEQTTEGCRIHGFVKVNKVQVFIF
jgi:hypothetical protein